VSALRRLTSGRIAFEGKDLAGKKPHEVLRMGLAQVPEGRGIFPNLTVDENLDLGRVRAEGRGRGGEGPTRVFELFPRLKERLKQRAGHALRRRAADARDRARRCSPGRGCSCSTSPRSASPPQLVQTIFRIIREINAGGDDDLPRRAERPHGAQVAHRAYVLEVGRVVMQGNAAELAKSDAVRKAYLGIG
jgi:branched-chain amino acid transport system ATP-binding protein